ncbi:alpha/beta fold hydrolase [Synechococcales cyanobacterium C]|uniref:Alpha/beta fold hydrolase n=1 Tax=Petrachloros mirabilis ULC683 TaxID=2781853 RepID=A0A8K1ZXX1_9CYAN|nr:alpha/beta hydrolase [Petrachloros mirabilis]NCJ06041.1 alpha/beta fold hydrolase [Petrachloros mirabilis ULC683]
MATIDVLGVPHTYELTQPRLPGLSLVFVHGWLLSRQYWAPLVQKLTPNYSCLTYDLRGFGNSAAGSRTPLPQHLSALSLVAAPSARADVASQVQTPMAGSVSDYGLAAYAQDLLVLLKHLGLERVWLVGHSLGGSIALWAAHLAPHQVQGVICINAGGGIYLKEDFEKFRAAGEQMLRFRPRWLASMPLLHLLFSRANVVYPVEMCWGRQRVIDFVEADLEAARRSLLDSTCPEEVHRLPQVVAGLQQPAYFLAGQQDQIMALKYVYHLASFHRLFQQGQVNVVELSECGHMAMIEKPGAIATIIQQIITQHSQP